MKPCWADVHAAEVLRRSVYAANAHGVHKHLLLHTVSLAGRCHVVLPVTLGMSFGLKGLRFYHRVAKHSRTELHIHTTLTLNACSHPDTPHASNGWDMVPAPCLGETPSAFNFTRSLDV